GEELVEGVVIGLERRHVASFAGAVGRAGGVGVVSVGDVGVGHRDAVLLHVGYVGQRRGGGHAVEAGEAGRAGGGVHDRVAVEVVEGLIAQAAATELRVDVLGAEERVEAAVAAGLVGQQVGLAIVGRSAQRAAGGAVHRQADEIGEGQVGFGLELEV